MKPAEIFTCSIYGLECSGTRLARHGSRSLAAALFCLFVGFGSGFATANTGNEVNEVGAVVAAQNQMININTADAATLAAGLQGVGVARAEEIIRYREAYGVFSSPDELTDVKGIGQATLDRNRAVITLE
ncbi:ComEA family DNA-binding protein [Kineobactrum sediminis]|nr:ComEA family DNA-binding protein [Kineobactrum sediminis]